MVKLVLFLMASLLWEASMCQPLSEKSHSYQLMRSSMADHKEINFVAVFMMGTLKGAAAMGEYEPNKNFFERIQASRMTWAHGIR